MFGPDSARAAGLARRLTAKNGDTRKTRPARIDPIGHSMVEAWARILEGPPAYPAFELAR